MAVSRRFGGGQEVDVATPRWTGGPRDSSEVKVKELAATVVVPTFNGATVLGTCLLSLLAQDLTQPYEVVVVDDGSTDGTRRVVEQARGACRDGVYLRYESQEHLGLNAGRNRGVKVARAGLVCLVDDDVEAPPSWLGALVTGAGQHPQADALGGPILLRIEGHHPRHCRADRLPATQLDMGPEPVWDRTVYGANLALRPTSLELGGPFREGMGRGDEEEWEGRLLAAGGHILYLPEAWVWHRRTQAQLGWRDLMWRSYRQGYSHVPYLLSTGARLTVPREVAVVLRGLGHAACLGCFGGLLRACQALGKLHALLGRDPEARRLPALPTQLSRDAGPCGACDQRAPASPHAVNPPSG